MRVAIAIAFLTVFAFTDFVEARGGRSSGGRRGGVGTGTPGGGVNPGGRTGRNRTNRGNERTREQAEIADAADRMKHIQARRDALDDLDRRASQEAVLTSMRVTEAGNAAAK